MTQPTHGNEAAHVEIRIEGGLDARWSAWFDGLTMPGVSSPPSPLLLSQHSCRIRELGSSWCMNV